MSGDRGFSLLELVIALGIAGLILAAGMGVAVQQQRFYATASDVAGAMATLKRLESGLANELLPLNATAGDIIHAGPDSLVIRLFEGVYSTCDRRASPLAFVVERLTRGGQPAVGDSAFIYSQGATSEFTDDLWLKMKVTTATATTCPDSTPAWALVVSGITTGEASTIPSGAPVRIFRHAIYSFEDRGDGGWFVVRSNRDGSSTAIAGPLLEPDSLQTGLEFRYLDASGDPTTTETEIARILIDAMAVRSVSGTRAAELPRTERTLSFKLRNN